MAHHLEDFSWPEGAGYEGDDHVIGVWQQAKKIKLESAAMLAPLVVFALFAVAAYSAAWSVERPGDNISISFAFTGFARVTLFVAFAGAGVLMLVRRKARPAESYGVTRTAVWLRVRGEDWRAIIALDDLTMITVAPDYMTGGSIFELGSETNYTRLGPIAAGETPEFTATVRSASEALGAQPRMMAGLS